jgi:hypothetical protein
VKEGRAADQNSEGTATGQVLTIMSIECNQNTVVVFIQFVQYVYNVQREHRNM